VQPWEPNFSMDHGSYGRHPAWVELCNLPIHMWQFANNFFKMIVKVISFDETQKYTFRPHPRACVMIDTNKELPKKLEIKVGGKVEYEIKILILGLPNACFQCKQTGHFIRNFPYKPTLEKRINSQKRSETPKEQPKRYEGRGDLRDKLEGENEVEMMEEDYSVAKEKAKEGSMMTRGQSKKSMVARKKGKERT